jgi:hypothetical protein
LKDSGDFYAWAYGCDNTCKKCRLYARRQQRHDLKPGQYERMDAEQDGVCAICGSPPPAGKQLDVDHSHDILQVRGLLCKTCNHKLHSLDNWDHFAAALVYLERTDPDHPRLRFLDWYRRDAARAPGH